MCWTLNTVECVFLVHVARVSSLALPLFSTSTTGKLSQLILIFLLPHIGPHILIDTIMFIISWWLMFNNLEEWVSIYHIVKSIFQSSQTSI